MSKKTPGVERGSTADRQSQIQELATIALQSDQSTAAAEARPVERHPAPDADAQATLALIEATLEDDKAEDLLTIPLAGKSDIADYMVIASGRSSTHVKAMADHVTVKLKHAGQPPLSSAGTGQGDWVAIDALDVIVHLFRPEVREFYKLEKMWQAEVDGPETTAIGG